MTLRSWLIYEIQIFHQCVFEHFLLSQFYFLNIELFCTNFCTGLHYKKYKFIVLIKIRGQGEVKRDNLFFVYGITVLSTMWHFSDDRNMRHCLWWFKGDTNQKQSISEVLGIEIATLQYAKDVGTPNNLGYKQLNTEKLNSVIEKNIINFIDTVFT